MRFSVRALKIINHPLFYNAKSPITKKIIVQNVKLKGAFFHKYEHLTKVLLKWLEAFLDLLYDCDDGQMGG